MSSPAKSIFFAAVLSIICGSLLTLASKGLEKYQLKNIEFDRQQNILKSVGLLEKGKTITPDKIEQLYSEHIRPMWVNSEGTLVKKYKKEKNYLQVYLYIQQGSIKAYIIPVYSRGLWGKIFSYLAIGKDGNTIFGFTVYRHQETPGLGAEIDKKWFQQNFVGKKILDDQGDFVSITIAKGNVRGIMPESQQQNFVDGISGASMTGKFLSEGLKQTLINYEPLAKRLRKNAVE